jgi:hypothetical protein
MENHYHLLLETPEANLSRVMQWVNVNYSLWFNRLHSRAGHLFQGHFKAVVLEDDAGWQELGRYVHLNPCACWDWGWASGKRRAQPPSKPCSQAGGASF